MTHEEHFSTYVIKDRFANVPTSTNKSLQHILTIKKSLNKLKVFLYYIVHTQITINFSLKLFVIFISFSLLNIIGIQF